MITRSLGNNFININGMGLGTWAIGGPWTKNGSQLGWGNIDDRESIRSLHRALDLGVNFFDTAPNYGAGHSEKILGQAFADRRDEVIIATKFGTLIHEGDRKVSEYPDHQELLTKIRQDCEASLRRLETDYIDLYQFHMGVYPLAEAVEVRHILEELVAEGKIRGYGWSTDDLDCAQTFAEGENCVAIQHNLNVLMDAPEMLEVCEEYNLASINRGPLGRGLLTGKYKVDSKFPENDNRHRDKFHDQWAVPILERLDDLREVLTSGGRTLTQGALGWIWARNPRTISIPGFKTVDQVEENINAIKFGPLSEEEMRQIDQILSR